MKQHGNSSLGLSSYDLCLYDIMLKLLEKWLSELTVCKQADIVLLIQPFVIRSQQLIAALAIEEQKKISVTSHWFLMHLWSMFSDELL